MTGGTGPKRPGHAPPAPAGTVAISTLKKRHEFLRLRGGARCSTPGFAIESKPQAAPSTCPVARFGYTVTKQIGNAVIRNRIRRRLRAIVAAVSPAHAEAGHDYVLFARLPALDRPFDELKLDLEQALARLHKGTRAPKRP